MRRFHSSRSYLFIPANRADFIAKAHLRGADTIVLDLEDSIPQDQKASARAQLPEAVSILSKHQQAVAIRVNSDLENLSADLPAIDFHQVNSLLLPKAEDASVVNYIETYIAKLERGQQCEEGSTALIPMIETCRGALNMRAVANASPRVIALTLGSEDLSNELGAPPTPDSLLGICQQMALISGEAGIAALGFPGSIGEIDDIEKLTEQLSVAKRLGFSGALCVHPVQVAEVNQIFTFSAEQKQWAERVVAAMAEAEKQGLGVCKIDGRMIDAPVVNLAKQILKTATVE